MATNVTIIYNGPIVDEIRKGANISRIFVPTTSYVDTPVFTEGFANEDGLGDGESYGRSIYATNVEGQGFLPGLIPQNGETTKFAQFQLAIFAAADAEAAGAENTGITFSINGYEDEIYWIQTARNMAEQGFYIKVGDKEFGEKGN